MIITASWLRWTQRLQIGIASNLIFFVDCKICRRSTIETRFFCLALSCFAINDENFSLLQVLASFSFCDNFIYLNFCAVIKNTLNFGYLRNDLAKTTVLNSLMVKTSKKKKNFKRKAMNFKIDKVSLKKILSFEFPLGDLINGSWTDEVWTEPSEEWR